MTEVTDIILPGNGGSFRRERRSEIAGVSGLDPFHLRLIEEAGHGHGGDLRLRGKARLTPMWGGTDGPHVLLNTKKGRLKCNNLLDRGGLHPGRKSGGSYHWIRVYGMVVELVDEEDPERGHLATESIEDFGELNLGRRTHPLREEVEAWVLFLIRADEIVTFGAPSWADVTSPSFPNFVKPEGYETALRFAVRCTGWLASRRGVLL